MNGTRIRTLPSDLVDQIAAGEVIEDPASVVKELLENSIDAGASRVGIEIEGGGAALIRVTDDGSGMSPDDAALALTRHATSKVATIQDLHTIRTLGFRGEALPSIASVSRFTLETRPADSDSGTRIVVEGGERRAQPCACRAGTAITVRDLFYNVPARLKFLKGERSRLSAIRSLVTRTALAFPKLHLTLRTGPRSESVYPSCPRLLDRAAMLMGRQVIGRLYEFSGKGEGIEVTGVLGDPELARPDPSRIILLVNDRPITDFAIRRAVIQAFSVLVPPGRYPVAVVRIEIDPGEVDVNVHPRKAEVRFRRQRDVAGIVFGAVQATVTRTPWISVERPGTAVPGEAHPSRSPGAFPPSVSGLGLRESMPAAAPGDLFRDQGPAGHLAFGDLAYIGQVANTILVCEGDGTLVLIDQHAAHERVNYDRLWRALEKRECASETLMFPEVIHLAPEEAALLESVMDDLAGIGFELEPYSGDSVAVRTVPAVLRGRSAGRAVRDCLASLTSEQAETDGTARLRKIVSTVACHASVRAGDELSPDEARALLASMEGLDMASYCPHGRQSVVTHPIETVLRWFGR